MLLQHHRLARSLAPLLAARIDDGRGDDLVAVVLRCAALDGAHSRSLEHLAHGDAALGVRAEHADHEALDGRVIQPLEGGRGLGGRVLCVGGGVVAREVAVRVAGEPVVPVAEVRGVLDVIVGVCGAPGDLAGEVEEGDGAGPDVHGTRVVGPLLREHLGRDVRPAAADARLAEAHLAHVDAALALRGAHARVFAGEDLGDAEVGDLEVAFAVEEQVLQLDVAVGDAVVVQVAHAAAQLLEETQAVGGLVVAAGLGGDEQALLDEVVQLAVRAELHDVVPAAVVGAQPHCLDDVGVVQALGDAVLGLDLLDVVVLGLVLVAAPEFLDGVQLVAGPALPRHNAHLGRGTVAKLAAAAEGDCARALELVVQLAVVDEELVGQAGAEAAGLHASALGGPPGGLRHWERGVF